MSESYTSFDLPLNSDPELFQRYINQQGGFREFPCAVQLCCSDSADKQVWASCWNVSITSLLYPVRQTADDGRCEMLKRRPRLACRRRSVSSLSPSSDSTLVGRWRTGIASGERYRRVPPGLFAGGTVPRNGECGPAGHARQAQ
jgi:hypothetical protein